MNQASFRFYSELNDFLSGADRFRTVSTVFADGQSVKHLIEALGVPHPEVDLILVNGEPVDLTYLVHDNDRVSVYPRFRTLAIDKSGRLQPDPWPEFRFVLDGHLGRLAAYLRMMGFDTLYRNDYGDAELARISDEKERILLTRDRGLLKRARVVYGYWVRATQPKQQLLEIVQRFDLALLRSPFERCLHCNGKLRSIAKEKIAHRLPEKTRRYYDHFRICGSCERIYWDGSHVARMQQIIDWVLAQSGKGKHEP